MANRNERMSRREMRAEAREREREYREEKGESHGCFWQIITAPFRLVWWFIKDVLFFWAWWW